MTVHFSVPSKTFLIGEYAILFHGAALLLSTASRFELTLESGATAFENIAHGSPAHRLYAEYADLFAPYRVSFQDPYQGLGGLGASSAQFLLVYAALHHIAPTYFALDLTQVLNCYQHYTYAASGLAPSGADVIAQWYGQCTYVNKQPFVTQTSPWPFSDINFYLLHTHKKLPTHTHLQNLNITSEQTIKLQYIVSAAYQAFSESHTSDFCACINSYADYLQHLQLTAEHTQEYLQMLQPEPWLRAAKGCGALGSDVLLLLTDVDAHQEVVAFSEQMQLPIIAHNDYAQAGLTCNVTETTDEMV